METRNIVVAILKNNNEKYLLNFRDSTTNKSPLSWALFGGGIEPNESADNAIKREMKEELGEKIASKNFKIQRYLEYRSPEKSRNIHVFTCNDYIKCNEILLGEGAGFGFFTKKELPLILRETGMTMWIFKQLNIL